MTRKGTKGTSRLQGFISRRKLSTKLLFLILFTGMFCFALFRYLWLWKWGAWHFLDDNLPGRMRVFPMPPQDFFVMLNEEALKYDVPDSEDDKEAVEALAPFFEMADSYTALYVYGLEDGMYRAGVMPEALEDAVFESFFQTGYRWTDGVIEQPYHFPIKFRNGYADVIVNFYHSVFFMVPYFIFCMAVCILLFLFVVLFFVMRKIKTVVRLERAVLAMSAGDLKTPVPAAGEDEIGILAGELDRLRLTLSDRFQKEREVRTANQELVAAMSHDLRTPLTILKGYLEILCRNRVPQMREEYAARCIRKAEEIQEMTDRMFEYALAYDGEDLHDMRLTELSCRFFFDRLREHADFLRLAGFTPQIGISEDEAGPDCGKVWADPALARRALDNLFSNILKYADKKERVEISAFAQTGPDAKAYLAITLKNFVRNGRDEMESTQIGLKSAQKMMERMEGALEWTERDGVFTACLRFLTGEGPA